MVAPTGWNPRRNSTAWAALAIALVVALVLIVVVYYTLGKAPMR